MLRRQILRQLFRRGSGTIVLPTPTPTPSAMPDIAPGLGWAGIATTAGAPVDQDATARTVSTYAKSGTDVLTEPGGLIVDSNNLVIGIHAYAGNALGPLPVVCEVWIEGATFAVPLGSYTFADANGNLRTLWGYFARIRHASFTQNGAFNVKWNLTCPADPTYQNRTVGPFTYTRVSGFTGHDLDVTVGAGGTYADLPAAFAAFRAASAVNPRATFVANGTYELGDSAAGYKGAGYCTLEAAPGVTAHLKRSGTISTNLINYHGLRLRGSGVRVDMSLFPGHAFIFTNNSALWKPTILDGCVIYNSAGLNSKEAMRQASRTWLQSNGGGNGFVILDDTLFHDLVEPLSTYAVVAPVRPAALVRNMRAETVGGADVLHLNVTNVYGLKVRGQSLFWFTDEPTNAAGQIQYASAVGGAATTATWETSTAPGAATNTLTLKKDGATVATIALNTNGSTGYRTIADIKAAVEANSGWTLTVQNDIKDAQWLTDSRQRAILNQAVPATSCLDTPSQMYTIAGYHGDLFQPTANATGPVECLLAVNFDAVCSDIQELFVTGSTNGFNDCFFINYAAGGTVSVNSTSVSQTGGGAFRNCHWWHCTLPDQRLNFLNTAPADGYCSMRGSILREFQAGASFLTGSQMKFDSNFIQTRVSTPPNETNALNAGSTIAALLTDQATGDFSAKLGGGLATVASLVAFDASGAARGATSHIGAFA